MDVASILIVILTLWMIYISQHLLDIWRYLRKAMLLPSRKSLPIFGHSLTLMGPRNSLLERLAEINNENPPIFVLWFGPVPVLTIHQPDHIETILGSAKYIEKSFQYKFLEPWLGTGLLTSKGIKWQYHRKLLTPTFHFSILEYFIEVFSEKSRVLVKKLQKAVGSDSTDIFPYITMCSLDIICETAMGVEINAQENEHSEYVTAVQESSGAIMHRIISPWFFPKFLFDISSHGKRFKNYLKMLHDFTNQVIRERKTTFNLKKESKISDADNIGRKKKLSFLDLLLETSKSENVLTDEEIREEVDTFMFEGHDTTAAGISWALQMLASYPNVQEKVFDEMENIFQGSDRQPTMKDLSDMKYLERVIKETLRLYPSVPLIARYLQEDLNIDGMRIPGGITVLVEIYLTHRDPQHFPDPEKFNPDNFLSEKVAGRHPYAYIPFSAGPRNCIGQKFALLEEKTVLSYIVRHYKLEATTDVPKQIPELILRPDNGVQLKIIPRFHK